MEKIEPGEMSIDAAYRAMMEEGGVRGEITGEPFIRDDYRRSTGGLVRRFFYPAEFAEEVGGGDHESRWFTAEEISSSAEVMDFIPDIMRKMGLLK